MAVVVGCELFRLLK